MKSRCSRVCVQASLRTSRAGTSTWIAAGSGWKQNGPRTAEPAFSRFPRYLVRKLAGAAHSDALLRVPTHTARMFDEDLRAAGIEKDGPDGLLVFHSWRATYGTLLDSLGASAKETQELMRHSTPVITMQRYVQAQLGRRQQLVERMAEMFISAQLVPETPDAGIQDDGCTCLFNTLSENGEADPCSFDSRRLHFSRSL